MPIPKAVTRINRAVLNRGIRPFAGKIPPLSLVIHQGRSTDTEYRTPVLAFPTGNGFVIALVYGRHTDWERNVLSAGSCTVGYRNSRHASTDPEIIAMSEARDYIPRPISLILQLLKVEDALRLRQSSQR